MKKTLSRLLICAIALIALTTVLVACNKGNNELPEGYHVVTFNYNMGEGLTESMPSDQFVGVPDGGLIGIRPGFDRDKLKLQSVLGYYFVGWYFPSLDAEGNLQYDEDHRVILGEEVDFKTFRVNEDVTLYAKHNKSPKMLFIEMVDGKEEVVTYIEGKPGRTQVKPTGSAEPRKDGWTFLGKYYADSECTEEFVFKTDDFTYQYTEEDVKVYVQFVEGTWAIVRTEAELRTAISSGANVYLMNDIRVADVTNYNGDPITNWTSYSYNGVFNGNGYTVSNIRMEIEASKRSNTNFGIFGELNARAEIYNVNFEDCYVKVEYVDTSVGAISVGFFAWKSSSAKLHDITVSGEFIVDYCKLNGIEDAKMTYHPFIGTLRAGNAAEDELKAAHCDWSGVNTEVIDSETE